MAYSGHGAVWTILPHCQRRGDLRRPLDTAHYSRTPPGHLPVSTTWSAASRGSLRPLLAKRLRQLEQAGVIERRLAANGRWAEYRLSAAGRELERVLESLGQWGARWAFGDPRKQEQDPALLLWWMRRRINRHLLLPRRVVVRFDVRGSRRSRLWLVLEPKDVSVQTSGTRSA